MKKNNWEVWHELSWTEFELHSAIFGTLRKNLYPDFLVRGEYVFISSDGIQIRPDISIFKAEKGKPATLKLVVEIKSEHTISSETAIQAQLDKYKSILNVPVLLAQGRAGLKDIVERVQEHL